MTTFFLLVFLLYYWAMAVGLVCHACTSLCHLGWSVCHRCTSQLLIRTISSIQLDAKMLGELGHQMNLPPLESFEFQIA